VHSNLFHQRENPVSYTATRVNAGCENREPLVLGSTDLTCCRDCFYFIMLWRILKGSFLAFSFSSLSYLIFSNCIFAKTFLVSAWATPASSSAFILAASSLACFTLMVPASLLFSSSCYFLALSIASLRNSLFLASWSD